MKCTSGGCAGEHLSPSVRQPGASSRRHRAALHPSDPAPGLSHRGGSSDLLPSRSWGWHCPLLSSWKWSPGPRREHPEQQLHSLRLSELSLSRQPLARRTTSLTHQARAPEFRAEPSPSLRRCSHTRPAPAWFLSTRHRS